MRGDQHPTAMKIIRNLLPVPERTEGPSFTNTLPGTFTPWPAFASVLALDINKYTMDSGGLIPDGPRHHEIYSVRINKIKLNPLHYTISTPHDATLVTGLTNPHLCSVVQKTQCMKARVG